MHKLISWVGANQQTNGVRDALPFKEESGQQQNGLIDQLKFYFPLRSKDSIHFLK